MIDTQPNAFEKEIDEMMGQLSSKSAARRREAALFLGEVAAADAVPALVKVYQKDKNAQVRAAAAYSLGMYKAVEHALNAGDEAEVVKLLTQIEEEGKIGKRAPIGRRFRIVTALVVSLATLFVIYFFSTDIKGMLYGSTRPRSEVVASVQQSFTLVKNDTRTLQTELLDVIANHPLGCVAFYNNPARYTLDPVDARTFRDVAAIVTQLNTAEASLASAKGRYDDACNSGAPFDTAEAQQTFQLLLPALQALDPLEVALTQLAAFEPTALPATLAPVSTSIPPVVVPTSAPTLAALQENVTLQPTIPPEVLAQGNPKIHLPALFEIIDQVRDTRGASTLLVQYWEDAQTTGSTSGCTIPNPPVIPNNNVFIPEADYLASPDLRDGVQLINSGLAALHTGWVNFRFACNARTLGDNAASELQTARVAATAFEAAEVKLQAVQSAP